MWERTHTILVAVVSIEPEPQQQLQRQQQRQKQHMSKLDHRTHNLNIRSSYLNFTVLHYACSNTAELNEAVQILCEHKANVNLFDRNGFTPLHLASMLGHITVVKHLLLYNANPSSTLLTCQSETGGSFDTSEAQFRFRFSRGEMPLHLAAGNGHINVVRELLNSGAEVATENEDGSTPLHFAFEYQSNLSALNLQVGNDA
jgi:ankyrin repeat protein